MKGRAREARTAAFFADPPWVGPALHGVVLACLAVLCCTRISDFDVWWHLSTGRWIVAHGAVPREDVFSYTMLGRPWVAFEWLSQVLFYGAYSAGGAAGLTLLKTAALALTFAAIAAYGGMRRAAAAPGLTAGLIVAVWAARLSYVERPQVFTFLFTAVFLLVLKRAEEKPRRLMVLPVLECIWANLHGGACVVGLVLVGAWWAGALFDRPRRTNPWRLSAAFAACAAAALINPNGAAIAAQLFGTLGFAARTSITEWVPLRYDRSSAPVWIPLLALEAASAAVWLRNPARRAAEGLLWLAAIVFSFQALRFATQAALIFAQILAGGLSALLESWRPRARALAAAAVAAAAFAIAGTWFYAARAFPGVFVPGLGAVRGAEDAIAFMQRSDLRGNLFNSYELGGQVLWNAPGRAVFIDGRSLEYGPEFVREAINWFRPDVWRILDGRYRFQIALIQNGTFYACSVLDSDPSWRLVYWDDAALVYARTRGPNAVVAGRGYRFLQPNRVDVTYLAPVLARGRAESAALLAEADRSVAEAPEAVNPRLLRARVLRRLGRLEDSERDAAAAMRLAPQRAEPCYEDGVALEALGRLADAESRERECLREAAEFGNAPLSAQLLNDLGSISYRRGERGAARSLWRRALATDPDNLSARHNLSVTPEAF